MSIPVRTVGYWAGTRGLTFESVVSDPRFSIYIDEENDRTEFMEAWAEGYQAWEELLLEELEDVLMDVSVEL